MYKYALPIFTISIFFVTMLSFYILCHTYYNKQNQIIHAWHFPMLLAILIELTIY